ncbi:hypothetical protein L207DRAFT_521183 [Hyaloscypha variabilis F]|uniref:Uncharacterized protein n=1 Tax=Hyaloscypha variabilis (strain UAMH 11265 / GT02V1 / F) TaxID=1149755 RepID=A0A2J6QS39_HYAVF|nr:hypothetical protein L207DRAFT_521183 [Hyaloscypha variabilis F]
MHQFLPHPRATRSTALPQISPRHLNHGPLFSPTAITAISKTQISHFHKAFCSSTSRWEKQRNPEPIKPSFIAEAKVAAEAQRRQSQREGQELQRAEKNKVSGTEGAGEQARAQAELKEGQAVWLGIVGRAVFNIVVGTIGFIAILIVEMFL